MVANQELLPFLLLVRFDLLLCHHRHTPGICSFVCSWWSTHHPQACRKRRFPIPELLINLIYVFWGYIFSSAKLISIKFFKVACIILIKLALSFVTGLCIIARGHLHVKNIRKYSLLKYVSSIIYCSIFIDDLIVVMWWVFLSGCK